MLESSWGRGLAAETLLCGWCCSFRGPKNVETTCPAFRVLWLNEIKMDSSKKKHCLSERAPQRNVAVVLAKKEVKPNMVMHNLGMPNINITVEISVIYQCPNLDFPSHFGQLLFKYAPVVIRFPTAI